MKKKTIIIICVAVLVALLIIGGIVGFIIYQLVKPKVPVTVDQFQSIAEENGYMVADVKSQFSEYPHIQSAKIAVQANNHQIEFYVFADSTYATNFFKVNSSRFQATKSSDSLETNVDANNHSKYVLKSNGKYMVVSRIDNTAIYVDVEDSLEGTVNDMLNKLGY